MMNTNASEWSFSSGNKQVLDHFLSEYRGRIKLYNCDIYIDHIGDINNSVWLTIVDRIRGNSAGLSMTLGQADHEVVTNLLLKKTSGKQSLRKTDSLVINFDSNNLLEKIEYRSIMSKPFKVLNSIKCER